MRMTTLVLATISAAALPLMPCDAAPATEAARLELHGAAAAMDAAWDRKDPAGFAALFAPDATIQAGPNAVLEGQAAIRAFFDRDFTNRRGTMRHVSETRRIDMVTADLALVDKLVRIERREPDGRWTVLRTFLNSSLLRRIDGSWRVRTVRAHVVADP